MNLHLIWALACAGCLIGGTWYGTGLGEDKEYAKRAREDRIVQQAGEAAQSAAASVIAANKPVNQTIVQKVQREIQTNTVYADCRHSPDGLRLVNQAITGRAQPVSGVQLPRDDASGR